MASFSDPRWRFEAIANLAKDNSFLDWNNYVSSATALNFTIVCTYEYDSVYKLYVLKKKNENEYERIATLTSPALEQSKTPPILAAAKKQPDTLFVYAAVSSHLLLWKVNNTSVVKDNVAAVSSFELAEQQNVTVLSVRYETRAVILVGTKAGDVYYGVQGVVPITINLHKVSPSSSKDGILKKLWNNVQYHEPSSSIVSIDIRENSFVSVSESGRTVEWNANVSGITPSFKMMQEQSLSTLKERFQSINKPLYTFTVLKSACHHTTNQLVAIALVQHTDNDWCLYCIKLLGLDYQLEHVVPLNRFVAPRAVQVYDLKFADNGLSYISFDQSVMMAVYKDQIYEFNVNATLLPFSMQADVVTHGVVLLAANGTEYRACYRVDTALRNTGIANDFDIRKAATELQAAFGEYYNDGIVHHKQMDEHGVMLTAAELCARWLTCETNPLKKHLSYVKFLKESGLYRDISSYYRWLIFSAGQEYRVYGALRHEITLAGWVAKELPILEPLDVGNWLSDLHKRAQDLNVSQLDSIGVVVQALKFAQEFREEKAAFYDIELNEIPEAETDRPVSWTSSSNVQQVLVQLLETWKNNRQPPSQYLQSVIEYAMQSLADSYRSHPRTKQAYVQAQKDCFAIHRQTFGRKGDAFLFKLAQAHGHLGGLCQIARDHEQYGDPRTFSLKPLLQNMDLEDVGTGMRIDVYVLKWHTERNLLGHVVKYGKVCPGTFGVMVHAEPSLKRLRWMHYVKQGDYNAAAANLFEIAVESTITEADYLLAGAIMSNEIVLRESFSLRSDALHRQQLMEKKRELINVHKTYLGENDLKKTLLWSPKEALNFLIGKIKNGANDDNNNKLEVFEHALAVCTTFDEHENVRDGAALIWMFAIHEDKGKWNTWVHTQQDLTSPTLRQDILQTTVVGQLYQQSSQVEAWNFVTYNAELEDYLFQQKLTDLNDLLRTDGMRQLLAHATYKNVPEAAGDTTTGPDPMAIG